MMEVDCEGEHSVSVRVDSSFPQGTVLGHLLFLCHINDLPTSVKSQVRLFADDCLLYRTIVPKRPSTATNRPRGVRKVGCQKKCYILSIRNKLSHFYQLNNAFLQQVTSSPYLGITIAEDLSWSTHISNICKKSNCTLGFLRRNLRNCTQDCKKDGIYITCTFSTRIRKFCVGPILPKIYKRHRKSTATSSTLH